VAAIEYMQVNSEIRNAISLPPGWQLSPKVVEAFVL
jgi:hypothetical protein